MIVTLLVSTGAAWETTALASLNAHPGVVVLKRCVDLADLLATASTGQADVAVLGADLAGLDRGVIDQLAGHGVRPVGVTTDPEHTRVRATRIGLVTVVDADRVDGLGDLVSDLPVDPTGPVPSADLPLGPSPTRPPSAPPGPLPMGGRVLVVWGPAGAPGRTTLATGLAGELARRGLGTLLVDADPHGGAVAQQLGILDEVSGLLAAARMVLSGTVEERFATAQRRLSDQLRVLTGLPRADRWIEVRSGVLTQLVDLARGSGQVVVDTGFSIEGDEAVEPGRPGRNDLTREALEAADEILLVGGADPVGLARVLRALSELHDLSPDPPVRLVVNRMRPTLGWREADVVAMVRDVAAVRSVHFLPDDQPAVDRALVAGRLLVETGDSPLARAIATLVDAMAPVRR